MSLNQQINHLYDRHVEDIKHHHIFITRDDATIVFTNKKHTGSQASLVAAAWQAVSELKKINNLQEESKDFRLSFDIADQGVYVLCFRFLDQNYFATMIYKNVTNPALHKRKFKESLGHIFKDLSQAKDSMRKSSREISQDSSKFLFQNISDDELDKVFSELRGDHVVC